jgi:hypothetical protein
MASCLSFRRLDFAVLDLFAQVQPADQLDQMVEIPSDGDDGFRVRRFWGGHGHIAVVCYGEYLVVLPQ